ncbi:MAG TPA: SDR family oxidoreductase [Verrucomicrobiae bacterium]|nr:SDR family oxidoreductase [Verrucomicrobiae bacterium]
MHRSPAEVVAITGASAGVGRATVQAFAKRGARIGLLARGIRGLEGAKKDAKELGGQALCLPTDVADPNQVEAAAQKIEEHFGPIDVWINAAMVSVFSPVKEIPFDEFRRVSEVTYLGTVHGTMVALKRMSPRDKGTIVQVGSALAYRSIPLQSAYCGAKAAIRGFTDSLRCELLLEKSRVHLTMVQLPAVNTPQFSWVKTRLPHKPQPVPPIYQPEIAAEAIYWAAHHHRRELFVGAPAVKAIEANKFVPGMLDRYLGSHGYSSQQTDEPQDPQRPHNLWEALDGERGRDYGAHGDFDRRARSRSPQMWVMKNRRWLAALAVSLAGIGLGVRLARTAPEASRA